MTVPLSAVHGIAEFAGTLSSVLKNDGTFLAVDGTSFFDGSFSAVLQNDGTTFGRRRYSEIERYLPGEYDACRLNAKYKMQIQKSITKSSHRVLTVPL